MYLWLSNPRPLLVMPAAVYGNNLCPRCGERERSTGTTGYCKPCRRGYDRDRKLRGGWAPRGIRAVVSKGFANVGLHFCRECDRYSPLANFHTRKSGRQAGRPTDALCIVHVAERGARTERKYNVNYDQLLSEQGGRCRICDKTEPGGSGKFHVDHDHACCPGKSNSCGACVRGLLCTRCNAGLGMFGDSPELMERAIRYVSARREL